MSIFYNILCASFNWNKCIPCVCVSSVSAQKIASQIDLKVISHQCISPEYENAVCHFSQFYIMLFYFLVSVVGWYFIWVSHVSLIKYFACPFLFRLFYYYIKCNKFASIFCPVHAMHQKCSLISVVLEEIFIIITTILWLLSSSSVYSINIFQNEIHLTFTSHQSWNSIRIMLNMVRRMMKWIWFGFCYRIVVYFRFKSFQEHKLWELFVVRFRSD